MNVAGSPDRTTLLIVTGGIAAYKTCDVVRGLRRAGEQVVVVMTPAATEFVTPMTFEALSGHRVFTELLPGCSNGEIDHIEIGRRARVAAVVPATADFVAKVHAGLAGDLGLATLLALPREVPVLFAPAMNHRMWTHPATQRNVAALRDLAGVAYHFLEPVTKELACGEFGEGGMADPEHVVSAILALRS